MELVPIVITSLEIVLAFAVITFIASYISYRIRSKIAPEKFEPQQDMKPKFATRRLGRLTFVTKEIAHIAKPKEISPKPKQQVEKINPKKEPVRVNQPKIAVDLEPKRISVMKNLNQNSDLQNKKFHRPTTKEKADLNSLGDDILNKYVDDDNHPLFSLKTNKDDSKD